MNLEYGKQMTNAMAALRQLYADCSKLLKDCDKAIGEGRISLFGNGVTRNLSRALGEPQSWMLSALYRYYDAPKENPGLVVGVTICFYDDGKVDAPRHDEPLLIVGEIHFGNDSTIPLRSLCKPWTLWDGFFAWTDERPVNTVIEFEETSDVEDEKIYPMKLIAVPLYSIQSINDVQDLLQNVREA